MALKGPLWLLGKAIVEERNNTPLGHLSSRALDLGLRKTHKTRGHMFQAIDGVQNFLSDHPQHKAIVREANPLDPYKPSGQMLVDWIAFLQKHEGLYGHQRFNYNYDILRRYLTPKYGGNREGGGGGDNEFEIALRLCASFM